jgi:hypothetical protein
MLLLEVIDLEYVLDTLRGNKHELRPVPRDRGAHVTSPSFKYIRNATDTSCVRSENQDYCRWRMEIDRRRCFEARSRVMFLSRG